MMKENKQENEKRKTLADLMAEYRKDLDEMVAHRQYAPTIRYVAKLLDRIEAAWKREKAEAEANALAVGGIVEASRQKPVVNAAAMREALLEIETVAGEAVENGTMELPQYSKIVDIAESALSAPPRQCDVGTAEEQAERFRKFCKMDYISEDCPDDCPLCRKDCSTIRCPFAWAQMPYEAGEGGAK